MKKFREDLPKEYALRVCTTAKDSICCLICPSNGGIVYTRFFVCTRLSFVISLDGFSYTRLSSVTRGSQFKIFLPYSQTCFRRFVMEWIWERYKVSASTNKYTAWHTISVPAGNGQAGRAPDSRETIRVRVPIGAIFITTDVYNCWIVALRGESAIMPVVKFIRKKYNLKLNPLSPIINLII